MHIGMFVVQVVVHLVLNLCYQSSNSDISLLGSNTVLTYLFISALDQINQTTRFRPRLGFRANQMIKPDSHCAVDTYTL